MVSSPSPHAMPRSISSSRAAAALVGLSVLAVALVPATARADDRALVETGRTAARAIVLFRDPRACGIALLHERCMSDVEAFLRERGGDGDDSFKAIPNIGPHPASGLRAYVRDGDRDAFDFALQWINNRQATPQRWKDDPRGASLYDAGMLDVFLGAAGADPNAVMLGAAPGADLAVHAAEIPGDALPLDAGPLRALKMTRPNVLRVLPFARDLVAALDTAVPPPALAVMSYGDGAAGDAALGVAAATVRELIDCGVWLGQADAQQFVDAYVTRLSALAPEAAALRPKLRVDAAFDRDGAQAMHTRLLATVLGRADVHGERASVGFGAAQLSYNASVVRDAASSATLLRAVATASALDSIPRFAQGRAEASGISAGDWKSQYHLGLRLVDVIMKGGPR